jgi:hypothetical protein
MLKRGYSTSDRHLVSCFGIPSQVHEFQACISASANAGTRPRQPNVLLAPTGTATSTHTPRYNSLFPTRNSASLTIRHKRQTGGLLLEVRTTQSGEFWEFGAGCVYNRWDIGRKVLGMSTTPGLRFMIVRQGPAQTQVQQDYLRATPPMGGLSMEHESCASWQRGWAVPVTSSLQLHECLR